jgi:hypothetical protein
MAPRIPAGRELLLHDRQLGVQFVAGADEAGRGALAGPIVAAAVLFEPAALTPEHLAGLERLNDSKKLSEARRDELAVIIGAAAISISVIAISAAEIDEIGIQAANAPVADHPGHAPCQIIALLASDGLLNFGIKILHPDAGAVHPRCGQGV